MGQGQCSGLQVRMNRINSGGVLCKMDISMVFTSQNYCEN